MTTTAADAPDRELHGLKDLAAMTGLSAGTWRAKCKSGEVPSYKVAGKFLVADEDYRAHIHACRYRPEGAAA